MTSPDTLTRYEVIRSIDHQVIAPDVTLADTFWQRFIGLMGKPGLSGGQGLWIEPCADIHSCFMRFAFDAVFVSKTGEVLRLIECMPAWRFSPWVKGAVAVLELPGGTITRNGLVLGQTITLQPQES